MMRQVLTYSVPDKATIVSRDGELEQSPFTRYRLVEVPSASSSSSSSRSSRPLAETLLYPAAAERKRKLVKLVDADDRKGEVILELRVIANNKQY